MSISKRKQEILRYVEERDTDKRILFEAKRKAKVVTGASDFIEI